MYKKCLRMRLIFGAAGFAIGAITGAIGMKAYMERKYYVVDPDEIRDDAEETMEMDVETVNPFNDYGRRIVGFGYDKPSLDEMIRDYPDKMPRHDPYRSFHDHDDTSSDDEDDDVEVDTGHPDAFVTPYVVSSEEFDTLGHNDGLSKEVLHYFVDEGMLYDEYGVIVSEEAVGVENIIGMDNMVDGDTMCIVNENLDLAFEIEIHAGYGDTYFEDDTTSTGGFVKTPKRREMNEEDDE